MSEEAFLRSIVEEPERADTTWLVLAGVLLATVPTTGDIGLTWDEPSYRYSQLLSIQWWERLAAAPERG